jgi:hypothetical protein
MQAATDVLLLDLPGSVMATEAWLREDLDGEVEDSRFLRQGSVFLEQGHGAWFATPF